MRCYKVVCVDDDTGEVKATKYAGTAAESKTIRQAFVDEYGVKKKDVDIEEVDIPTAKPALLAWVNANVK